MARNSQLLHGKPAAFSGTSLHSLRWLAGVLAAVACPQAALAQSSGAPLPSWYFGVTASGMYARPAPLSSSSGFYRGETDGFTAGSFGAFAGLNVARFGGWTLSVGPTVDVIRGGATTFQGTAGGAPVTSTGSFDQTNFLFGPSATMLLAPGLDLSLYAAFGASIVGGSGRPTGPGGPAILGTSTAPALRIGSILSKRLSKNVSVGVETSYQRTGRTEFETSLPGERFRRDATDEFRGGLRFSINPDDGSPNYPDWTIPVDDPKQAPKPKKKEEKKEEKQTDDTAIDCVMYLQYNPDTPEAQHAPEDGVANNADFKGAAEAYAGNLAAKVGAENVKLKELVGKNLPAAIASFPPKGKCCRSFAIFSHGASNGALNLPYDIPGTEKLDAKDKADGVAHQLGGPNVQKPGLIKHFEEYVKAMKKALCKTDATVVFNGCYTALGIAAQTTEKVGVKSGGFTGTCSYPQDKDTKKYSLPVPKKGGTSKYEEFKPVTEEDLKK